MRQKIADRFDIITVPRAITISDLCLALVVNLTLTSGSGFYLLEGKETVGESRKIVLKSRETGEYLDDFSGRSRGTLSELVWEQNQKLEEIKVSIFRDRSEFMTWGGGGFDLDGRSKTKNVGRILIPPLKMSTGF